MVDRIKELAKKFLEFWNRYTSKQKTIIITVLAGVIFALAVLVAFFSRTQYEVLETFETTKDAAEAKNILEENGFEVRATGDNATILSVDKKQLSEAKLLLGENGITADADNDYSELFDNSMSTTDYERKLKTKLQLQQDMVDTLEGLEGIKTASVSIHIPDSSNSIFKDEKESTVSITLMTTDEFIQDATGIASWAANQIGSSLESVRILDQTGTLLYSGTESALTGNATDVLGVKTQLEGALGNALRNVLISAGYYNDAQIAANLDVQLSQEEIRRLEYYSNDEDDTGPLADKYVYEAENIAGLEDLVGTDANGEETLDYNLEDYVSDSSTVTVNRYTYNTSQVETVSTTPVGEVDLANSSVAIVLSRYITYDEAEMEKQGLLDDITFAEFKLQNGEKTLVEVDERIYTLVEKATGMPSDSISILAYEVPIFYDKEGAIASFENVLQLVLAALIVLLILFVVFKGMKPVEVVELEPELSVEALLATTKENQTLDDIEFSEKSVTRQQIEKFVDENPEAVAALLRNWLNEDWE